MTVGTTWDEIWTRIAAISPRTAATLRQPASADRIAALEVAVGEPLPRGFREYLLACDGQDDQGDFFPLLGHNRFLGVEEMLATMAAESDDVVVAPSFDAFIAELLRRLVAGEFTLSNGVLAMDRPDGSPWVV